MAKVFAKLRTKDASKTDDVERTEKKQLYNKVKKLFGRDKPEKDKGSKPAQEKASKSVPQNAGAAEVTSKNNANDKPAPPNVPTSAPEDVNSGVSDPRAVRKTEVPDALAAESIPNEDPQVMNTSTKDAETPTSSPPHHLEHINTKDRHDSVDATLHHKGQQEPASDEQGHVLPPESTTPTSSASHSEDKESAPPPTRESPQEVHQSVPSTTPDPPARELTPTEPTEALESMDSKAGPVNEAAGNSVPEPESSLNNETDDPNTSEATIVEPTAEEEPAESNKSSPVDEKPQNSEQSARVDSADQAVEIAEVPKDTIEISGAPAEAGVASGVPEDSHGTKASPKESTSKPESTALPNLGPRDKKKRHFSQTNVVDDSAIANTNRPVPFFGNGTPASAYVDRAKKRRTGSAPESAHRCFDKISMDSLKSEVAALQDDILAAMRSESISKSANEAAGSSETGELGNADSVNNDSAYHSAGEDNGAAAQVVGKELGNAGSVVHLETVEQEPAKVEETIIIDEAAPIQEPTGAPALSEEIAKDIPEVVAASVAEKINEPAPAAVSTQQTTAEQEPAVVQETVIDESVVAPKPVVEKVELINNQPAIEAEAPNNPEPPATADALPASSAEPAPPAGKSLDTVSAPSPTAAIRPSTNKQASTADWNSLLLRAASGVPVPWHEWFLAYSSVPESDARLILAADALAGKVDFVTMATQLGLVRAFNPGK